MNYYSAPEMISNWSSVPSIEHKYNIEETIKSAVEIEYSQTSECHNQVSIICRIYFRKVKQIETISKNECMELMNTLQSSGKYHIVIGGNFVFQMKSIDELDVTPGEIICLGLN